MKPRNLRAALREVLSDARKLQAKADQIPTEDLLAQTALLSLRIDTLSQLIALEG
jgi:hypothetical protein